MVSCQALFLVQDEGGVMEQEITPLRLYKIDHI
jgi:hypothetical protein